jgi:hypothetical protein
MRPPIANHNSLGKLYHDQKDSLKKKILEDLHDKGIKNGKIGHWLRKIPDENLPNMPGNMQDTFIEHIPDSLNILKPTSTPNN